MANNPIRKFFEKVLTLLRVRAVAAGLEVGDDAVRLVRFDGKIWRMYAVRLAPGILALLRRRTAIRCREVS